MRVTQRHKNSIGAALLGAAALLYAHSAGAEIPRPTPDPRSGLSIPRPSPKPERLPQIMSASDRAAYQDALQAARSRAYTRAHSHVRSVADRGLVPIIDWYELKTMAKDADLVTKATAFYARHGRFPQWNRIVSRVEDAMDTVAVADRAGWFGTHAPITSIGRIRFGELLLATGKIGEGVDMVRQGWREGTFTDKEERQILESIGHHLRDSDHLARLDNLLWDGHMISARRQINRVTPEFQVLAEARIALRTSAPYVDSKIAKVPARLQTETGLIYERVRWRRRKGMRDEAADLLLNSGYDQGTELRPDKMWIERRILIRHYLKEKDYDKAYRLSAGHGFTEGAPFADCEWMAGWIKLRFLNDPLAAAKHFHTMYSGVGRPISRARGAYWLAEALSTMARRPLAQRWYLAAARYDMTFYGRLAREKLDTAPPVREDVLATPDILTDEFLNRPVIKVFMRLHEMGERKLLRILFIDMIRNAESSEELVLMAALGTYLDRLDLGLRAAKLASYEDVHLIAAAYPVIELPGFGALETMTGFVPEDALVLSVQRQESEFRTDAVSHAGASGLMQLMPATAKQVARQLNLKYSKSELLDNPTYNAMLGSAYLGDLITEFNGSYVMAVAGYNAGPHRVNRWVKEYGDPRLGEIAWVDWIELIPFSETRNYVQRVLEAVPIYREQLGEKDQGRLALGPILTNGAQSAEGPGAQSLAAGY